MTDIKLIPFGPEFATLISEWSQSHDNFRFWRGLSRMLTVAECSNLPHLLQEEILMVVQRDSCVGMVSLKEEVHGLVKFSILIDKEFQRRGFATSAIKELENYAFKIKQCRMILTECCQRDGGSMEGLSKLGYLQVGLIPRYIYLNGHYEGIVIFMKEFDKWEKCLDPGE